MPTWSSSVTPTTHSSGPSTRPGSPRRQQRQLAATAEPAALWMLLDATKAGYKIERCLAPYDLDAVAQALDDAQRPLAAYLEPRLLAAR